MNADVAETLQQGAARPTCDEAAWDDASRVRAAQSFERLFAAEAPRLLRFLLRRTRSREDAADLLQESFLRLIGLASRQEALLKPEAYLQQIASNLARDHARLAIVRRDLRGHVIDEQTPIAPLDPHQALELRQTLSRYEAALLELPVKIRDIFLLNRRDGLTYAQIARDRNISVSSVEKHMMKAIAHLDWALGLRT